MLDRLLRRTGIVFCALSGLTLAGCGSGDSDGAGPVRDLPQIIESGVLRVATRNAPSTWYIDRFGRNAGLEYDRAQAFADSLGVELELLPQPSVETVLQAVRSGRADLAASGLTVTAERAAHLQFSSPTQTVTEQLVCNRESARARRVEELGQVQILVGKDTSYRETLTSMPSKPKFGITHATTEALLRDVWQQELDCTVADSHIFALNRRYFPTLVAEFDLGPARELAWATHPQAPALGKKLNSWLARPEVQSLMADTRETYFAPVVKFDFVDMRAFARRIESRYPDYRRLFNKAAEQHGLDPILLAAQGYQESHWEADARSPTGVRGLMMLTRSTAESLGVTNRLNPKQSIEAGALYLAKMKARFADEVVEPDRTLLALAAYNIGRAHMHDAQKLARQQGKSPHRWADLKTVLPLLSEKKYYSKLKYGYARGNEPVRYVERIRNYAAVLQRHLKQKDA